MLFRSGFEEPLDFELDLSQGKLISTCASLGFKFFELGDDLFGEFDRACDFGECCDLDAAGVFDHGLTVLAGGDDTLE